MKLDKKSMILYAVTDRTWVGHQTLEIQVEEALKGGTTFVQLREKNLDDDTFLEQAIAIKEICKIYKVPFVINDNVEIAKASGADGVHIGQDDMKASVVRKILGVDKIIGVSVHSVEQAILAQQEGADYIGVGAMFSTTTKLDASLVSLDTLKSICNVVTIPVIAIGGINKNNILELSGSGIDGVAVVSALFTQADIKVAAQNMYKLSERMVKA